jgi:hypothetical protein
MSAITICLRLGQNTTMSFFGQEKSAHPFGFFVEALSGCGKKTA